MTAEPEDTDAIDERPPQHGQSTHLARVCDANVAVRDAQAALRNAVEEARKAGHTWEDIATALITSSRSDTPDITDITDITDIRGIVQTVLGTGPADR